MLYKNLPSSFFTYVMVSRLFLDGVASMKFLVDGGWGDFFAVLRAHAHFYRKLPALQAKRKKNNPQAVRNVYRKNIVIEYFLKRKTTYDTFDEKYFS